MKELTLYYKDETFIVLVDDEDYDLVRQYNWFIKPCDHLHYAIRNMRKENGGYTTVPMHRLLMGMPPRNVFIDHVNGNGLDNQRSNLRECTPRENKMNSRPHYNTSSKYKNVYFRKDIKNNPWQVRIRVDGKLLSFGCYPTEEDAMLVANEAIAKYHGEFGKPNTTNCNLGRHF